MITPDDMLYDGKRNIVIGFGIYRGVKWAILTRSIYTYPLAYIQNVWGFSNDDVWDILDDCINVNGGVSFYDPCYWNVEDGDIYIGWDYGHASDLAINKDGEVEWDGKKWTYSEILNQIETAIDNIYHNMSLLTEAFEYKNQIGKLQEKLDKIKDLF